MNLGNHLHWGIVVPNYGPALSLDGLARSAAAAEKHGFESIWLTDHVAVTRAQADVYGNITEALVTAGFLAGQSERLRVGISALVVPQRQALLAIKQIHSLCYLSQGRLIVALAAGWLEPEFRWLGMPFSGRGRSVEDFIALNAAITRQAPGPIEYDGLAKLQDAYIGPPPGGAGPELWVAGSAPAVIRRAARIGTWHPVGMPAEAVAKAAADLRQLNPAARVIARIGLRFAERPEPDARDERGRPAIVGPPGLVAERLQEYVDAGANGFTLMLEVGTPGLPDRIARFAQEVRSLVAPAGVRAPDR